MSQKVHARSLRVGRLTDNSNSFFREQKLSFLYGRILFLQRWSSLLLSKIYKFPYSKSLNSRLKKAILFSSTKLALRPLASKIYLSPLLIPFAQKAYRRKYLPIKKARQRRAHSKVFISKNNSFY